MAAPKPARKHYRKELSVYPDDFPRNGWYIAAHSSEVNREFLSRWILGDPILFYRTEAGEPVALVDRCIHRQMPLSLGNLRGDQVECGYHGLTWAPDGHCTRIPGRTTIPDSVRVQGFPLHEGNGFIWIWMGDPEKADTSEIPDHHWYTADGWATAAGTEHMNARAQLLNENLLDLSHLSFLHLTSIGSPEIAETPVKVESDERWVRVSRTMPRTIIPPYYAKVTGIDTDIEREQYADFFAPAFHVTTTTLKPYGDADDSRKCHQKTLHGITPETRTSTHYFWSCSRDFAVEDTSVTDYIRNSVSTVIGQDIDACEAIEHIIAAWEPSYPEELNIKVDGGPLRSRKIIQNLLEKERADGVVGRPHNPSDAIARAAAAASTARRRP
ncbi:vanillate O-demethylase monooxygenase subunit [Rhodococcus koreensis]|uniref:Vanillate O-demethylase monooxygenase subunit n=2 Tax=Rhodococcus koreensis TaxID=99653 RepID=A0A1H5F1E5_9NOCA|nr:vanillate O-demethylase monooxygenase subunit [Rhodococcus koreensis]